MTSTYARELRAALGVWARTRGGSLSLSTTPAAIQAPLTCTAVSMFAAAAFRVGLNHRLKGVLRTDDDEDTYTNYTQEAIDADAATLVDLSDLDTAANEGYFYVGFPLAAAPTATGLAVDVVSVNGTASTLTAKYYSGEGWATLTITDGTKSGSTTLAQDGNITWTALTAGWIEKQIAGITACWIRFQVSAAMDSATTIGSISLLTGEKGYFQANTVYDFALHPDIGTIESSVDTSTSTLYCTWIDADRGPA